MGNAVVRVNGDEFAIVRPLGEGGFSTVHEVRRGKERFALKRSRGVSEREDIERAQMEIKVQRQLQHPNNLRLLNAEIRSNRDAAKEHRNGQSLLRAAAMDGVVFGDTKEVLMVFPIMHGGTLQAFLERAAANKIAAFSEKECLRIFALLLDAVKELHEIGYAHRDIKPGNVLLSTSEPVEPILMDFGSVAPLDCTVRSFNDAIRECEDAARFSSAPYRAPELWEGSATTFRGVIDGRADVWSLGCVLYAMAFGPYSPFEHPRDGVQPLAILSGSAIFESGSHSTTYSPTFIALIRWILTPDTALRPTLEGVRQCVQQLRFGAGTTASSSNSPPRPVETLSKEPSWADFTAFDADLTEPIGAERQPSRASFREDGSTRHHRQSSETTVKSRSSTSNRTVRVPGDSDDVNRRRAISRSGKLILVKALSNPSIEH